MTVLPGSVQLLIMLQHGLVGKKTRPVALIKTKTDEYESLQQQGGVLFIFFPHCH